LDSLISGFLSLFSYRYSSPGCNSGYSSTVCCLRGLLGRFLGNVCAGFCLLRGFRYRFPGLYLFNR
jgi:hypothetical protein